MIWTLSDSHHTYEHKNQQHLCFCVRMHKSRRQGKCTWLPSFTGRLSADQSFRTTRQFLNISIMAFLFSSPKRSLVWSDLLPVCIIKEGLHNPAHPWYFISLQALGANSTTSALPDSPDGACVCAFVCVQAGTSTGDKPEMVAFPDLLFTQRTGL